MFPLAPLLANMSPLYSVPLIVAISLVYSATRHEDMPSILKHSARLGLMITVFMVGIMAVLQAIAWWF